MKLNKSWGVLILLFFVVGNFNITSNYNNNCLNIDAQSNDINQGSRSAETIVINEFMADPDSDWDGDLVYDSTDDEWVELVNFGTLLVDVSSWSINDSTGKRFTFLPGTTIPPGGFYLAFGSNQSLSLNNGGDTIELLNATDFILDSYTYYSSSDDISIGRLPDGERNWTEFNDPTPGVANGVVPKIVINELMYAPAGSDTDFEWLELFNNDTRSINITNWELTDQDGEVDYIFKTDALPYMIFPPQKYILIHSSAGTDELDFGDGVAKLYMGRSSAMLNNDGDDILFTDRGGLCIDYLAYGKSTSTDPPPEHYAWDGTWYNTSAGDYNIGKPNPIADEDCTIRLVLNGRDTNSVQDWGNASGPKVTPGRNNNEIIGLDVVCGDNIHYINTTDSTNYIISVSNTGNLMLNLFINSTEATTGWSAGLSHSALNLPPHTITNITLTVSAPSNLTFKNQMSINISVSATNVNLNRNITLTTIIPAVDFEITKFEVDGSTAIYDIFQGEVIQLKATVKNLGILNGSGFKVEFYYDAGDSEHLLGGKEYDYIYANGYKYPSIYWDTLNFQGNHTLIVVVDCDNEIEESNENNNRLEYTIHINPTDPSALDEQVLITEVYYDTKTAYDTDEFIKIFNPTNTAIDISGWQLTDDPDSDSDDTVVIPDNTWLESQSSIYITDDGEAFLNELGLEPMLACDIGSLKNVILLENPTKWPGLSNAGDLVLLRNKYRHIIDMMCYGTFDASCCTTDWHGPPVPEVSEGKILKRQRDLSTLTGTQTKFLDTDSAADWLAPRTYGIGQSDFYPQSFTFTGEVIPFVSPESSFTIITSELESAKSYIYLNLYEFTHPLLAEHLLRAVNRKVTLRILMEGNPLGWNLSNIDDPSYKKDEEYTQKYILTQLYNAGAQIKFLSDIKNDNKNKNIFKRYNYDHAKYAVIDGETSIVMSGNWKPSGVPTNNTYGNREWGVVINDLDVAEYLKTVFEADWQPVSELQNDTHYYDPTSKVYGPPPQFFDLNHTNSTGWYEPITEFLPENTVNSITGEFSIEPVISPDTTARTDAALVGMILSAKESVYIQQMDCNFDWILTHTSSNQLSFNWSDHEHYYLSWADGNHYYHEYLIAAIDAARRGCEVRVLLDSRYIEPDVGPGKVNDSSIIDNFDIIQYLNELARIEGLSAHLEARLSHLTGLEKVHNKGVIVDEQKVLVSSINWNYNSISNNREIGVIIDNSDLALFYTELFNNDWSVSKSINDPVPTNNSESAILITELYADTYQSYDADEYIALSNPTNDSVDISGWIITDKLTKYAGYESTLVFPVNTRLLPKDTIYITRNASAFHIEHNFLPDFEYFEDSRADVPQLELIDPSSSSSRDFRLANKGDEIVLADEYLFSDIGSEGSHIVDMVVYGNSTYISDFNNISYPFNTNGHWVGSSSYNLSEGEILKRNRVETHPNQEPSQGQSSSEFLDTNSAGDWENNRVYHPGQSDFVFNTISYSGSITVFSSPDSSYQTISGELEKASGSIYLSVYQFHNLYLMDKLINASMRGVDVKVFLDGAPVGGITDSGRFVAQQLAENGCEVRFIRSLTTDDIHRRYRFVHTKYAVIDNFTTIVMSENWKTTGVPVDNTAGNRGWGVAVRNSELALSFAQVFFHDWNPAMRDSYAFNDSDSKYGAPPEDFLVSWAVVGGNYKPRFDSKTINGEFKVTPVVAPDTTLNKYGSILELITSAVRSVYIEQLNCYLDWDIKNRNIENLYLSAAIDAARRGCQVKILLDSAFASPDNTGLDNYDTVEYINSIARAEGLTDRLVAKLIYIEDFEGKNELTLVHNKGIIVDGHKTLISSINWATGSVLYNREAGVIIENEKVARFYTEIFNYDWNLTVNELIDVYVLHSNTRDLTSGESTEYVISIINTQPETLFVNLSISGLEPGWNACLDLEQITLPGVNSNLSELVELRLTVFAPSEEYLSQLNDTPVLQSKKNEIFTLELGIRAETRGMAADVIFTTTSLVELSQVEKDEDKDDDEALTRTMIDPWLVIVLLSLILIIGAVARDLIHHKLKNKREHAETYEEPALKDHDDTELEDNITE